MRHERTTPMKRALKWRHHGLGPTPLRGWNARCGPTGRTVAPAVMSHFYKWPHFRFEPRAQRLVEDRAQSAAPDVSLLV